MTNTTSLAASSTSVAESQGNDGDWAWSSFAADSAAMEDVSTSADYTASVDDVLVTTTSDSPEERTQVLMWYGWGLLSAYCFFFILAVFGELIYSLWTQYQTRRSTAARTRTRRRSPFNLYLVFMMIPDLIMSGFCAFTCIGNAITRGALMSHGMCYFQSWYVVFGFSGSSWMNALIAAEVYRMLQHPFTFSGAAIYQPPTLSRISRDSLAVLTFAAFVSSWGLWDVSWLPLKTTLNPSGISCFPSTQASSAEVGPLRAHLFFYGCFIWMLLGAPFTFVAVLCYRIVKNNLLPPQGRQRVLAIFFFRLGVIFLVMWIPSLFMVFIFGPQVNPWIEWAGGLWAHLQGFVSAAFILTKMEVFQSVRRHCCCCASPRDVPITAEMTGSKSKSKSQCISGLSPSVAYRVFGPDPESARYRDGVIRSDHPIDLMAPPPPDDVLYLSDEEDADDITVAQSETGTIGLAPSDDAVDRVVESDNDWDV